MKCQRCFVENPDDTKYCGHCGALLSAVEGFSETRTLIQKARPEIVGGKYRILEEIGRGGMGVVYKAEDLKLQRTVALKFLSPALTENPEAKLRFTQEARAAAALDHPNICTVYEVDDAGNELYIAMGFVEGQTLKNKMETGPLAVAEAVETAIRIAEALKEAHGRDIVHRDIKPSNIIIDTRGQTKVMDFGLAKVSGQAHLTREGAVLGTLAFMSPEQARGDNVDHRTDIWSLGVVLYEMLGGKLPFEAENEASALYAIVHEAPIPLRRLRKEIPVEVEKIVARAMAKSPKARYQSAAEMLEDLRHFQKSLRPDEAGIKNLKSFLSWVRQPVIILPMIGIIAVLGVLAAREARTTAKKRWARNRVIPEIVRLAGERNNLEAFKQAREIASVIPDDRLFRSLWDQITETYPIQTVPENAKVYVKDLRNIDADWIRLDITEKGILRPKVDPAGWMCLWKVEKEGYESAEFMGWPYIMTPVLAEQGSIPEGMVSVRSGISPIFDAVQLRLYNYETPDSVKIEDFLLDRHEVTNREYKRFIDAGGYQKPEFWKHGFVKDGRTLSRDEAFKLLTDKTGRPGPATWEFGTCQEGHDEYPVGGISWYEAAAYAEFAGKALPSVFHWDKASSIFFSGEVISGSNFGSGGPSPRGSHRKSIGIWGTYDMAGNVREWCQNAVEGEDLKFALGAAWNDPPYFFLEPDPRPPIDRSPGNGFRCAKILKEDAREEHLGRPLRRIRPPDWKGEKPLSDEEFNTWMGFLSYAPAPLEATTELIGEDSLYWRMEKISFNAAYDEERMSAFLFIPRISAPPYQTVVIWPGADALFIPNSQDASSLYPQWWDHLIRDGRAVLFPIYKGTYDRGGGTSGLSGFDLKATLELIFDGNTVIKHMKDLMRSIDFLSSRADLDKEKIGFWGFSWGAHMGPMACAIEKRIKTGILVSGSLWSREEFGTSHLGWSQRCRTPMLMISGEYDSTYRFEDRQKPYFQALGAPPADKKHIILPDGHVLTSHWKDVIRESLAWLDKYLGPVKKRS